MYCKDCKWRNKRERCDNPKIHEEDGSVPFGEPRKDHLVYSYYEDGAFWVGDFFGCVHFEKIL